MLRDHTRGDEGQLTVLIAGFTATVLMLLAVVVQASAAFLARRDLVGAVDAAAVAAAQRVDLDAYYESGADAGIPLDRRATADVRAEFSVDGVVIDRVELRDDGRVVHVTGRRLLRLPLGDVFGIGPVVIRAEALARSPLR